ncbi:Mannose-1-phosphate guanylyltransferase (GDP) [Klebsiella pneumoniae IS46]|nr:Mannose-1-phosphate guanylyltransferase (GDP) [Klebsiella pneumoniae IS46]
MKAIWSPSVSCRRPRKTGYGYIQRGVALTDSAHTPYQVARFVEKPDRERAEAYLASGEYYWNSGMFMFRAKKYLSELAKFRPDILEACQAAVNAADNGSDFISIPHDIFLRVPGRVRGLRGDGENRRRGGGRSRCRLERRRLLVRPVGGQPER